MSEDGGISTLEADGSTVAIVPDWVRDEFCECVTRSTKELTLLVSLPLKLICEGTDLTVLFWLTVANELSSTGGEEMLIVVVLFAATDRRFPLGVGDGI